MTFTEVLHIILDIIDFIFKEPYRVGQMLFLFSCFLANQNSIGFILVFYIIFENSQIALIVVAELAILLAFTHDKNVWKVILILQIFVIEMQLFFVNHVNFLFVIKRLLMFGDTVV